MKSHVKLGLIIGAIGLVVNTGVSALLGVCGPVVALVVGAVAGVLTAGQTPTAPRSDNMRRAAVSAAIAGALTAIGQLIGGLGLLYAVQVLELPLLVGRVPVNSSEAAAFWFGGLMAGGCFGTIGLVLAVLGGAGAGYIRTQQSPVQQETPPGSQSSGPV